MATKPPPPATSGLLRSGCSLKPSPLVSVAKLAMGSIEESAEEVTRAARWQNVFLRSRKGTLIITSWELITGAGLSTGAALLQGMNPSVFVVYRKKSDKCSLGLRSFSLMFLASLVGVAINQNVYFEGMYLASSSRASAMGNLVPVITFVIAFIFGLEKINIKSLRSIAKILGTLVCVTGAVSMALLKGPKLLNAKLLPAGNSIFGSTGGENWLLGCLFLFASSCCWSIWLIRKYSIACS